MSTTSRLLLAVACLAWPAVAHGQSTSSPKPPKSPAGLHRLEPCQCLDLTADSFKPADGRAADVNRLWPQGFKAWQAWRRHVEVLRFEGSTPENATFLNGIRNVTNEDEVLLHIGNEDPLAYGVQIDVTSTDSPARTFLVIDGEGAGLVTGLFTAGSAAAEAAEDVEAANANSAGRGKPAPAVTPADAGKDKSLTWSARTLAKPEEQRTPFEKAWLRYEEAATSYQNAINDQRNQAGAVAHALVAAQSQLHALQRAIEDAQRFSRALEETTAKAPLHALLPETPASATSLATAEASHETLLSAIRMLSIKVAVTNDLAAIARAKSAIVQTLAPAVTDANATSTAQAAQTRLDGLDAQREALSHQLGDATAAEATIAAALAGARVQLQAMLRAYDNREVCLRLGSFPAGTRVFVRVALIERPMPSETSTEAAKASPDKDAPAQKPKPPADPPARDDGRAAVDSREISFDVLGRTVARTNLGFVISGLKNRTFDHHVTPVLDDAGKTVSQTVVLSIKDGDGPQVRPAFHVALYPWPSYQFAEADTDPYESVRPGRRYLPFATFGFSLTDSAENFFLGGGTDIARGVSVMLGLHLGRVTRLREHYALNEPFDFSAGETFKLEDVTETGFHPGLYGSLSVDPGALLALFSKPK